MSSSSSTNFNKIESKFEKNPDMHIEEQGENGAEEKSKSSKIKRNSSLISLKSINQNLKAILKINRSDSSGADLESGKEVKKKAETPTAKFTTPSLRIDNVDIDESKMLLIYPQSPMRYPSSASGTPAVTPTTSSTTPLLQYQEYTPRSNSTSPYLSISHSPVRRSSTSDILSKKPSNPDITVAKKSSQYLNSSGSGSALVVDTNHLSAATAARRPSTSEMLRKARERKGSEGKIGRSFSSASSLARGGNRNRRLSMAF